MDDTARPFGPAVSSFSFPVAFSRTFKKRIIFVDWHNTMTDEEAFSSICPGLFAFLACRRADPSRGAVCPVSCLSFDWF